MSTVAESSRWYDTEGRAWSASELLKAYEDGEVHGETPLRISANAPPRPFRRYLRELVWAAYGDEVGSGPKAGADEINATAFHKAPVPLVISDLAGRILHSNSAITRLLGYEPEELRSMRVGQLSVPGADREEEIRLGNEVLAGKRDSFQMERSYLRKNGETIQGLASISMVRDSEGAPSLIIGQILDLTRIKELERELVKAERLQTAGRLASGVAHDFNNLITVILGELDRLKVGATTQAKQSIESIREVCAVGGRMNAQLMAFSREGVVEVEVLDVRNEIQAAVRLLRAMNVSNSSIEVVLPDEPLAIEVNATIFEQIIINLGNNARHAMPDGGLVTVRAYREGEVVFIQMQDDGKGMPPEIVERVFEPFFSTRKAEGGTGLGLATVYGNVKRFGGTIGIESQLGKGTTITMAFPAQMGDHEFAPMTTSAPAPPLLPATPAPERVPSLPAPPPALSARVLVVDDQEAISDLLRRVLERAGYEVSSALGVQAVRDLLDSDDCPTFDLLLTDLDLEDGSGLDVVKAFQERERHPGVLFVSGYDSGVLPEEVALGDRTSFLRKPFEPDDIVREVALLLGGAAQ